LGNKIADGIKDIPTSQDCVIYYLGGYLIRHASKFTQCRQCIQSLQQIPDTFAEDRVALLTRIKDFSTNPDVSFLKHPSEEFYSLLLQLENTTARKLGSQELLWGDMFFDCLDALPTISVHVGLGCSIEHVMEVIPKLILHYIRCRFFFRAREIRHNLSSSSTAKKVRKLSKVVSS